MFFDVIIVGAGIAGLAHAHAAARRGLRVAVFERSVQAQGASIRNFGFVWPIGQPSGEVLACALRGRETWLEILREGGFWHRPAGSLHIARNDLEAAVIQEFHQMSGSLGYRAELLDAAGAARMNPFVRREGLAGALWSQTEIQVSPAEVIGGLPRFLAERHGVEFHFGTAVREIAPPKVRTARGVFEAGRVIVCSGGDFGALYPEEFRASGISPCKLQMMALDAGIAPGQFPVCVAGGLSMRFYKSFRGAPSLPKLARQVAESKPLYDKWGIHVMAGQAPDGALIAGDSHEYGEPDPFNKEEIDELIIEELGRMLELPRCRVARRWAGVYARHPEHWRVRLRPAPGVEIVEALAGSGMTLAFGVAEETFMK